MRTKTKKTKQITQIVVSMLLVLTMVFMPMKMILAADAQSSSTPTQFVLVLDCSGSMEESDVNGLSPKAAKMFVDMMPVENAQIAIVAFGANWGEDSYVYPGDTTSNTYTKVILGMTDVGTEKAKKKVKEAIDETAKVRDKNGYTTIGYALQAAKDVLKENKAAKANGCVVLMSDGRQYYLKNGQRGSEAQETKLENGAEIYKSESLEAALKDFKEKKWPVYTLEMSADIKDYYDEAGLHTPKEWKGNGGFKIPTGRFYMLPDFLVPYKHYNEETISGVLDGIVNPDDEDSEVYPSEMTMLRWHHWFILNQLNIEGHMKSIGYRLL